MICSLLVSTASSYPLSFPACLSPIISLSSSTSIYIFPQSHLRTYLKAKVLSTLTGSFHIVYQIQREVNLPFRPRPSQFPKASRVKSSPHVRLTQMLLQRNENLFGFAGFQGRRREEKKMRGCRWKAGSMISVKQLQFSSSAYGLSPCDESSLYAFLLSTIDNQELSIRQLADLIFSNLIENHNYPYKGLCIPWEKAGNRRTRSKRLILFTSQINSLIF